MQSYEKLGAFHLGRYHDLGARKTLLTFPDLRPTDLEPWVNPDEARKKGISPADFAPQQAELWKKGIASRDQDGGRIRRLREAAEFTIDKPLPMDFVNQLTQQLGINQAQASGRSGPMKSILRPLLILAVALAAVWPAPGADIRDLFKRKPAAGQTSAAPASLTGLSQVQMVGGLKEALGKGVQQAVASLGKTDGFLKDASVKIPMPESLQKVEKTLRTLRQDKLADEFVTNMNRAAEQAVPEAAAVLGDSIKQMSIADAKTILTGRNNAATQYFRRTSETNLHARFLPIVKAATEKAGVTGAYKRMTDKAGGGLGGLGGSLLGKQAPDLDNYVTSKTLDGLFLRIAEQEKQIRENPAARTTDLLQKVFGAAGK